MGNIDNLLPDIICILNLRTPLAEIVATRIRHQTIGRDKPKTIGRIICTSTFQQECTIIIHTETGTLSVFSDDIFGTIINGILKHLDRCRIESGIYTSPLTDGSFYFWNGRQPLIEFLHII